MPLQNSVFIESSLCRVHESSIVLVRALSLPRQYEAATEALKSYHSPTRCGDTHPSAYWINFSDSTSSSTPCPGY
jgi:hypothetical protein